MLAQCPTPKPPAPGFLGLLGLAAAALTLLAADDPPSAPQAPAALTNSPSALTNASSGKKGADLIAVAPPPFSEGVFPCSECHLDEDKVDTTRRELAFHEEIVFEHDAKNRWCLDCHTANKRDMLHLADGRLIPFTESYRLCGQCHGPQLKNWLAGDHGRRTGSWSGAKQYLLCAHCHNPHSPRFKPIKPLPPPLHQEDIR